MKENDEGIHTAADECAAALLAQLNRDCMVLSDARTQLGLYETIREAFSVGYLEAWMSLQDARTPSRVREEYETYLKGPLDPRD